MERSCLKGCFCSKEGAVKGCHSRFCRPQDSGIYNACRYKIKGNALCTNDRYVEDPRLQASGMTPDWITAHGFTLIELLVVVLIIGILAAIAMPQYQKAVEKSRVAEAFTTLDTLKKAIDVYVLEHGVQSVTFIGLPDEQRPQAQLDIDIPLDCDEDGICNFSNYRYQAACTSSYCYATAMSKEFSDGSTYGLFLTLQDGTWEKTCYYDGEKAEQICNSLTGLGWEPQEN